MPRTHASLTTDHTDEKPTIDRTCHSERSEESRGTTARCITGFFAALRMTGFGNFTRAMRPTAEKTPAADNGDDRDTGLPALRTWRAVYWFVLAVFALVVIGLTVFSRVFA